MRNFAHLPNIAPDYEPIVTLWPLLEGMLPHIVNIQHRDIGWDQIERFLSNQVKIYPLESIQLYHMMREQRGERYSWYRETVEAHKIIETAVENPISREETLSLIDFLASQGNYEFQPIYNQHAK